MAHQKRDYSIVVRNDGRFHVGYCLEIPRARGQGDTKKEAVKDTVKAIKLCRSHIESQKRHEEIVRVSV